jgi:hypothetical protein
MARAQHKLSRRALLGGACGSSLLIARRRHGSESHDASDGFVRSVRTPRRPALRVSRRSAPLLRKAGLRLGASGGGA